jgi:putative transposase
MANTYTQLYAHIVFAVKGRKSLIHSDLQITLYKYISGIVAARNQKLLGINGMPDHIHILISMNSECSVAELVRLIKSNSSKWINENNLVSEKFEWQNGYGAFSVSQSVLKSTLTYIENQQTHHKARSFREEYHDFLRVNKIDFKEEYLFEFME